MNGQNFSPRTWFAALSSQCDNRSSKPSRRLQIYSSFGGLPLLPSTLAERKAPFALLWAGLSLATFRSATFRLSRRRLGSCDLTFSLVYSLRWSCRLGRR